MIGQARQRLQQVYQKFAFGWPAQCMQSVSNLGAGKLAKIAVQIFHDVSKFAPAKIRQRERGSFGRRAFIPFVFVIAVVLFEDLLQILIEICLANQIPDLLLKKRQLGRVEHFDLIVLIYQLHELIEFAVGVGGGHGRDQMIDNDGPCPPLSPAIPSRPGSLLMNG